MTVDSQPGLFLLLSQAPLFCIASLACLFFCFALLPRWYLSLVSFCFSEKLLKEREFIWLTVPGFSPSLRKVLEGKNLKQLIMRMRA